MLHFTFELRSPNTELSVTLTNTNIQLGFTGFFNISWSNLSYNIDGAVFATLSTNIAASMNYNKNLLTKNLIPEVPQVPIGPLLITLKPTLDFSLPLHIEVPGKITSKMCVEVAGLFTAGVTASFNYGIEWVNVFWFVCLPRPYFSSTGNTWSTYDTIAFVGSESGNTIALNGIKVSLTPTISFGLKAGLLNFLYGKCSINVGLENAIQIAYKQPKLTGTAMINLTTGVSGEVGAHFEIPIINIPWDPSISFPIVGPYTIPIVHWTFFEATL